MAQGRVPKRDDRYFQALYQKPPDFKVLAQLDPEFAQVCKGRDLDFDDPQAVMQLTKTLLKLDFELRIELPEDRLCPPVVNRHNYILWLKKLLDTSTYDAPGGKALGVDIGTGASCIYPLLGCTERPWSFVATDIDEKNLEWARNNVSLNDLGRNITVLARSPDDTLIPVDDLADKPVAFTMTNPPFYDSEEALVRSAAQKSRPPFTACTGAKVEMVTEGGEVRFVSRIIDESLVLRERIQWYTAMLGFLSSVTTLLEKLKKNGIDNYAVAQLVQGSKTRRWVIGWSFQAMRPAEEVARGVKTEILKRVLPPNTEAVVAEFPLIERLGEYAGELSGAVEALDLISWSWDKERLDGVGRAVDKVWARAWRRWKQRQMDTREDHSAISRVGDQPACMLGFQVWIRATSQSVSVGARWVEGHDEVAFESFLGFLKTTAKSLQERFVDKV